MKSSYLARAGLIAAIYAALTLIALTLLQGLAWGPVQFRVSECVCVLALFMPEAVPGLTVGCVLANLINIPLSGSGVYGLFDVFFGALATLLAAWWMRRMRTHPLVALLGPVLCNALIVPAYLPVVCVGMGFYTIPFTTISLDGVYPLMYLFGFVATGIGEAVVMYALGLPLYRALRRSGIASLGRPQKQATEPSKKV
ncbi:MAG: QueT transporter family protein [Coriobacteriaceae bacterium]|nr:QueT transporter family protein [Coriobacteriaceae bacterium]